MGQGGAERIFVFDGRWMADYHAKAALSREQTMNDCRKAFLSASTPQSLITWVHLVTLLLLTNLLHTRIVEMYSCMQVLHGHLLGSLSKPGRRRQREELGKDCFRISDVFATLLIRIVAHISFVSAKVFVASSSLTTEERLW